MMLRFGNTALKSLALRVMIVDTDAQTVKFKKFPRNFFDLVIIDECHRGGANDESAGGRSGGRAPTGTLLRRLPCLHVKLLNARFHFN